MKEETNLEKVIEAYYKMPAQKNHEIFFFILSSHLQQPNQAPINQHKCKRNVSLANW